MLPRYCYFCHLSVEQSLLCIRAIVARIYGQKTYKGAMTTVYPSIVRVASRKGGRVGLLH